MQARGHMQTWGFSFLKPRSRPRLTPELYQLQMSEFHSHAQQLKGKNYRWPLDNKKCACKRLATTKPSKVWFSYPNNSLWPMEQSSSLIVQSGPPECLTLTILTTCSCCMIMKLAYIDITAGCQKS